MGKNNIIFLIYNQPQTVFRLNDIAMLSGESDIISLSKKLNYQVNKGKLQNPRKGIYAKSDYNTQELVCKLYTPSYISLEYVLQQAGVVFQYNSTIQAISYLSRTIVIENKQIDYHKIKGQIIADTRGIMQQPNGVNIATPERAFLDMLYLNKDFYFDYVNAIDVSKTLNLLPVYQSMALGKRVKKILGDVRS